MPILQIKLLVISSYSGRDLGYQSFLLSNRRHHKYLEMLSRSFPCGLSCHWMLCWKQSILVVCMGSNPVSCCDVCFSPLSSRLALEHSVLSYILISAGWSTFLNFFFIWGIQEKSFCIYIPENENTMSISLTLKNIICWIKTGQWSAGVSCSVGCRAAYWLLFIDSGFIFDFL